MYAQFYGLEGEPFLLTPDQRFYFQSSVHTQAMAHLRYGLSRGEGFIVITGEVGAGKTTLVKRLCASIDTQRILYAHVVTTQLEGADLLRVIASAFGLKNLPNDKSSLLIQLQNFFEATFRYHCRSLLIVDEVQNLSISSLEELRMLSNFQIGNVAPFQSFLVGQPQFKGILASPDLEQLRQRVIATYHLGPMNRNECGEYLVHRLQRVGWKSDPSFDNGAIDAIFEHTGGIPRQINTLCTRLLLLGFLDELHHFSAVEVQKVAADLEAENPSSIPITSNGGALVERAVTQLPAPARADSDLLERIHQLESRLAHQEAYLRRVSSAFGQLGDRPEEQA